MKIKQLFPTFTAALAYLKKYAFDDFISGKIMFPFMLTVYPVLFLYAKNLDVVSYYELIGPVLWVLAFTYALISVVNMVIHDIVKASAGSSLLLLIFFSYGHIYDTLKFYRFWGSAISHGTLLLLMACLYLAVMFVVFTRKKAMEYLNRYLRVFTLLLYAMTAVDLARAVVSDIRESLTIINNGPAIAAGRAYGREGAGYYPDIYYIITDSYSSGNSLKMFYGFDNSDIITWLKNQGFVLPEKTRPNYGQTALSLPSSLNMGYINDVMDTSGLKDSPDMSPLKRLMAHSALVRFLKSRGYTVVKFIFGYTITDAFVADITVQPEGGFFLHEFTNHLANTTILICFRNFVESVGLMGASARRVMTMLEGLPITATKINSPKFVFAHILCPHPPFIFDKNGPTGKYVNADISRNKLRNETEKLEYKKGYLGQIEFLNKQLKKTLYKIIHNSKRPPVIIVQADHGSGMSYYEEISKTNIYDRFSILNAYYLPYGGNKIIYDGISPVNSFREVLNYYFGTKLERLPDRSYFNINARPYQYTDITDKLGAGTAENNPR